MLQEGTQQEIQIDVRIDNGRFSYSQPVLRARPGQMISWRSSDGYLAIQYKGLTPGRKFYMSGDPGVALQDVVRDDAFYGSYKYMVALFVPADEKLGRPAQLYIDDPEVLIET